MLNYVGLLLDQRYEMIEIIGTGGMAVVYKARDIKLNRLVAVKILKDEIMDDEELRSRFRTEAEAVATLNHPNIVSIFDVSYNDDIEYFVMELVDGVTLKQYMQQRGQLNETETLHFISQILKALGHAHSRKIIHRDIKPQNVMILRDGTVKVTDFGIARIATRQQTVTQNAFGSVHYIAPEQARGAATDGRTDIYSVGIMMFEMLAGKLPFQGDTPIAVTIQHLSSPPPPLCSVNPDVSRGLESIVMKAMNTDPDERYATADDMLEDIEKYRADPANFVGAYVPETDMSATQKFRPKTEDPEQDTGRRHVTSRQPAVNPESAQKKRKKKNDKLPIIAGIISALVFMVVAVIVFLSMLKGCDGSGADTANVVLPKLVGQDYDSVVKSLSENDDYKDLVIVKGEETYSEQYAAGVVIAQDPSAGFRVKANSTVTLDVSLGTRELAMVDVTGIDYGEAKNKITSFVNQNKLTDVTVSEAFEPSETVAKNVVIRTEPAVGETVKSGDIIKLVISNGGAETSGSSDVTMTNLHGYTLEEATSKLQALGLVLGSTDESYSALDAGIVVGQSVKDGELVASGTKVNLIVSKGPRPEDTATTTESTSTESTTESTTETTGDSSADSSSSASESTSDSSASESSGESSSTESSSDSTSSSTESSESTSDSSTSATGDRRKISYTIELPASPETFTLTLVVNGTQIKNETLSASDGSKTYSLEGVVGTTYVITVYIDGEFYKGESVTF